MKKTFNCPLLVWLVLLIAILAACTSEEDPVPVVENEILSEDYIEGIYVVGFNDNNIPIHIETTNPAVFSPHASRNTFDIHSSGKGEHKLPEGAYWVNYHFTDEPNNVRTLPILITKNKPHASKTNEPNWDK